MKFALASGDRPLPGYTIKRGIGRGGFGEVYYAISDAGKEVALKLVRRNLEVELRGVTQCLNLKHPNLVSLFDVREDEEDNSWVVMEYVAGQSLEEVLEQNPKGLSPQEAQRWLEGIAAGVAYLHDHGIVHRDLKPGNIFNDEGIVKLGDYGLSKFISCSRRSGQTESIGTVHYMAPEVAGGRYGKEIDIYALGIILYEMLTGHVPFEGESVGEVLMKHLTAEPDVSVIAQPFRATVERALSKDPDSRFSSVQQFLSHLRAPESRFAAGQCSAPPVPLPRGGVAHPATASATAAAAATATAQSTGADDPVWATICTYANRVKSWFADENVNVAAKAAVAILAVIVIANSVIPIATLILVGAVGYGAYVVVRAVTSGSCPPPIAPVHPSGEQVLPVLQEVARPVAARSDVTARRSWQEKPLDVLALKSAREKVTELLGSLLLSSIIVAALSIVMVLLRGDQPRVEHYVWLTLVSTACSWAVITPAKFWEGQRGDPAVRRFVMLVIGMCLGLVAWGLASVLLVELPTAETALDRDLHRLFQFASRSFYDPAGAPLAPAFVGYFAFLMLMVRWWRQANPLRLARLSLPATGAAILAAWLLNIFWLFPQPWGLMVAATTSIAVQLSTPWVSLRERTRPRRA